MAIQKQFPEKDGQKTGTCTSICRGSGLFSGPEPHPARWVVGCGWDELDDVVLRVLLYCQTDRVSGSGNVKCSSLFVDGAA